MTTFGQIVYSVLDILKEHADDAYYTEEHIIFLASKMRAFLLERKYKNTKNSTFVEMSDENEQEICISLEATDLVPGSCDGPWLKSTEKIPTTLAGTTPRLLVPSDMVHSMVIYIAPERMPYVGYNKWLKNIIYASKSKDGYLYFHSNNQQFMFLGEAKMSAMFSDPEEAAKLACEGDDGKCDILSAKFPLESSLVPSCIELVVQELLGSRYAPEDKNNNAGDDLGKLGVTNNKSAQPAEKMSEQS